jgi:hypothetical protein
MRRRRSRQLGRFMRHGSLAVNDFSSRGHAARAVESANGDRTECEPVDGAID